MTRVQGRKYHVVSRGGMKFTDAIWFWKNGTIGRCYEPSEQIQHGGAVYDGHRIKGYTPG
jgi:hypothetical protein